MNLPFLFMTTIEFTSPGVKQDYEGAWLRYLAKKEIFNTGQGKSFIVKSTPYRIKPMTKLQKAHNKGYTKGREECLSQIEDVHKMLQGEKELNQSLRKELETTNQRIKSLRAVMQSINTISQGTSTL